MSKGAIALASIALVLWAGGARAQTTSAGAGKALNDLTTWGVFGQDESKVIAQTLLAETTTFPTSSGAGGFSWRFDPALGTFARRAESFGPLFAERPLTSGRHKLGVGLSFQYVKWDSIGGQPLANYVVEDFDQRRDPAAPQDNGYFSIHSGSRLALTTATTTASAVYGVSDRVDVAVDIPFVRASVSGANLFAVHFNEGDGFASGPVPGATSSGLGDIQVRTKFLALSRSGFDLAGILNLRLPTGDEQNLLGIGKLQTKVMGIGSLTLGAVSPHFNIGYIFGGSGLQFGPNEGATNPPLVAAGPSDEFDYTFGADIAATPSITVAGDVIGRTLFDSANLRLRSFDPPSSADNVLLFVEPGSVHTLLGTVGCKIKVGASWLLTGAVLFPLNDNGLKPEVTPVLGFERAF